LWHSGKGRFWRGRAITRREAASARGHMQDDGNSELAQQGRSADSSTQQNTGIGNGRARGQVGRMGSVDLLLLNCSNLRSQPVYPYAFVQLRAAARAHGLVVKVIDFVGYRPGARQRILDETLRRYRPRMIGIHLRQADSVSIANYAQEVGGTLLEYFPLEDTRVLVEELRCRTEQPLVVGGFGFTTAPRAIYDYLAVDYGVLGEPDAFFGHFERLCKREPDEQIENLLFRKDGAVIETRRTFFSPADYREYDEEDIGELERFYGTSLLYSPEQPTVAVELARGCPYRCYFCTEPHVKGRTVRTRNLDAVFGDVEFLARHSLRAFWLICSELNMGNAELALTVAERFVRLNEGRHAGEEIRWRAYHLPRWLSRSDLALLYRSGFDGGWNDFPSFDDGNLRATQVPYRSEHVLTHLRDTLACRPEQKEARGRDFSLFLGNAYMTPRALLTTIRRAHESNLANSSREAQIGAATRVFDVLTRSGTVEPGEVTFRSHGRSSELDRIHPTFSAPAALVEAAGSTEGLWEFFRYAQHTLFSANYRAELDWCRFLRTSTRVDWVTAQLDDYDRIHAEGKPVVSPAGGVEAAYVDMVFGPNRQEGIKRVMDPSREHWRAANQVCERLVRWLVVPYAPQLLRALEMIGLQWRTVPEPWTRRCELFLGLLERYGSDGEAATGMAAAGGWDSDSRAEWQYRYIVHDCHVVLRPEYRALLFSTVEDGGG